MTVENYVNKDELLGAAENVDAMAMRSGPGPRWRCAITNNLSEWFGHCQVFWRVGRILAQLAAWRRKQLARKGRASRPSIVCILQERETGMMCGVMLAASDPVVVIAGTMELGLESI